MSIKTCAAEDCKKRFEPYSIDQIYCSSRCRVRVGVRAHRNRLKHGGDDGGGPGSKRKPLLFPKQSVSAKRLKRERPPETAPLFAMFPNGMHEKHVGPVEAYADPSGAAAVCPDTCYRTQDESPDVKPSTPTPTENCFDQAAA